jgi:tetratricopeptide (TPR) repeat protein
VPSIAAEAEVLGTIGVRLAAQGELVDSQTYQEESLAIFRRLNMPEREQWLLGELGYTATRLGDYATGEKQLTAALAITRHLKDVFWQAWVKLGLGAMWNERRESENALPLITEAFQTVEQLQQIPLQARVLYDWGNVLLNQAEWANAEQKYQKAYDLWGIGDTKNITQALARLSYVTYQQEMPTVAAAHAEQLWEIWQASPAWAERADLKVYWMLGVVWQGLRDSRANDVWEKAHALLQKRSEKIPDEVARKMYLEQVPAHRAILRVPV